MLERVAGMSDDVSLTFFLEIMFDRNQNILLTKKSNMPATRSNIVRPTNVI